MNKGLLLLLVITVARIGWSQAAGNAVYSNSRNRTSSVTTGNLSSVDPKDSSQNYFIEANVLMNVRADEYVAIFALAQEAPTLPEANGKIATQVNKFLASLGKLGVKTNDVFIDFISQNRVYDFVVADNTAKETQTGFEVKKNVAVRYKDRALLDELLVGSGGVRSNHRSNRGRADGATHSVFEDEMQRTVTRSGWIPPGDSN